MGFQDVMRALADPTRREILNMLKAGELTATEIGEHFQISGPAISRHLAILREAGLIRSRREGKFLYYALCASVLEEVMLWLRDLKGDSI